MNSETENIIREALSNVLQDFAFMFAEPPEDDTPPMEACIAVQMAFHGPISGTAQLAVPVSLASELAANVLGVDPEESNSPEVALDAVKELLNVTTGNLVTALAGEEPIFDLTIPEPVPFDHVAWGALSTQPGAFVLLVEDRPLLFSVVLQSA
ncbi:MAG: chemotaxis protein CheX [Candidatus Competibacteraceae bacterium]|nr:chemotaxis protein CheX [Candidatus Competibacteraceae bacterium]